MTLTAILIVLIFIGLIALTRQKGTVHQYTKQQLLSAAERSFYGVMVQAVGKDYEIFAKPRVADVLKPMARNRKARNQAFFKITSKHFDFILCASGTLEVLAAIELDDKSHQQKKRQQRDTFLNAACESAKLPLIRIEAASGYNIETIKESIKTGLAAYSEGDLYQGGKS